MKNGVPYPGILTRVLLGCFSLVTVLANAASWETNFPMVVSRYWHSATLLSDGKVLAAGGYSYDPISLNSAELFDPAAGKWVQTGSMNDSRGAHAAVLLPNGQVLVTGGFQYLAGQNAEVLASAELFNPAGGIWKTTSSMLESRVGHTMTLLPNGQVLAVGGDGNGGSLSTAELYNPVSGNWTSTGHLNVAREWHTATLLANGQVLVVGGYNYSTGLLSSAELYDPGSGTWTLTANPMNFSRQLHTATLLPDGRVLVAGGCGTGGPAFSSAEIYDPDGQTWTVTIAPLNFARAQHAATLMPDGEVLVTGGYPSAVSYMAPLSSAEVYNPATGTWTATNSMPVAVGNQTATLLPNGNVLAAGGLNSPDLLGGTEIYDPTLSPPTGTWTNTGSMQTGHAYHTATLLPDGRVLVAGGGGNISSVELYNSIDGTWTNTGSLRMGRGGHTATLLPNGRVLVAGGFENQDGKLIMLASAELYDPNAGTWRFTGNMRDARAYHTATLLPNGKVLVAGGQGTNNAYLGNAELYDPISDTWKCTASMTTNRAWQTATLLADGNVLVAGGVCGAPTNFGTLDTAELYDPATRIWTRTGAMTYPRAHDSAAVLPDGKVLVAGGDDMVSTSPTGAAGMTWSNAELFDPALGRWTVTGSMSTYRDYHTAVLLPEGKVLVAGNASYSPTSELFNPATGTWKVTGNMGVARLGQTATLLCDGRVLMAGGLYPGGGNYYSSAELYDSGLGYSNAWQPQITAISSPLNLGGSVVVSGAKFRGVSEASGGSPQHSSTDYPLVQLRSLESGQTMFLLATNWSTTSFESAAVWNFPPGWALATVFVNGIQSTSAIVNITVPVPVITTLTGAGFSNGQFRFSFTNPPGALFGVLATTNLSMPLTNWTAVNGVTEIAPGQFQFSDSRATNSSEYFYRLYAP